MIIPTCAPASARPRTSRGWRSIVSTAPRSSLRNGQLTRTLPSRSSTSWRNASAGLTLAALRLARRACRPARGRSGRRPRGGRTARPSGSSAAPSAAAIELGPPLRVAHDRELLRPAAGRAAPATPARRRTGCGTRGRRAGRCRARWSAGAGPRRARSAARPSRARRCGCPGTRFVWLSPNVAGPPGAPADLAEQRDLGLRAPLAVGAALAERGRRLEHAALAVAHHLRDREQLVRVGVRAGHDADRRARGAARCVTWRSRARRRRSPRRRARTSRRRPRRWPASRRSPARPSRGCGPRSARPSRRR